MGHYVSEPSIDILIPDPTDDLVRLGREMDGGYVVPSRVLTSVDMIVSLGIEDEWSFEEAFLRLNSSVRLVGVDGSTGYVILASRILRSVARFALSAGSFNSKGISESRMNFIRRSRQLARFVRFWLPSGRRFLAKMVRGAAQHSGETDWNSLQRHWTSATRLLIKVDIEGSEYDVLHQIIDSADQTTCLIIEFHDLERHWEEFSGLMASLRNRFRLVHTHANNWGGTFGDRQIPQVVELTFVSAAPDVDKTSHRAPRRSYPLAGLDFPNNPSAPDIPLAFGS